MKAYRLLESFLIVVVTVSFTCVKYIVSYRKYMFEGNKFL